MIANALCHPLILQPTSASQAIDAILQYQRTQGLLILAHPWLRKEVIETCAQNLGIQQIFSDGTFREIATTKTPPIDSGIGIFSSGSTGLPKLSLHQWKSLQEAASFATELESKHWLLTYGATTFAALQVILSANLSSGKIFPILPNMEETCLLIVEQKIDVISATPSFWKKLISTWPQDLPFPQLAQATSGGEAVDQKTLDLISSKFNPEQLTHIYASSEAGSCIVVSDRKAGFPSSKISRSNKDVELKIIENELWVRSPRQRTEEQGNWYNTRDLVKQEGSRIFFVGRADGLINVGGNKVMPEEVEDLLISHPCVHEAVVYSIKNPIVGNLVAAQVVLESSIDPDITEQNLKDFLSQRLESFKIPRKILFVNTIEISPSGKKKRQF